MPAGLKIVSALFAIVGALLLLSSVPAVIDYQELSHSLARSGIAVPVFLLTNIVFPAAMIAGSAGLWARRTWAWWLCAIVMGLEVVKKLYFSVLDPQTLFGTFPLKENIYLVIAICVLVFLFSEKVFRAFHGEPQKRLRALGIVAVASLVIGGLFTWQATLSREALSSNISLQATPQSGAPELKR